ncbi:MAG: hypothetical protein ACRCVT_01085 [Leadbetterella sp.]
MTFVIVSRHPQILQTLVKIINQKPLWDAFPATNADNLYSLLEKNKIDFVLLSSGLSEDEEKSIRSTVIEKYSNTKLIQHFGGGSGLLFNEIQAAIDSHPDAAIFI